MCNARYIPLFKLWVKLQVMYDDWKTKLSALTIAGFGRCLLEGTSCLARRVVLHGPNLHRDIHPRDGRQVAGPRLRQVLHQRLVLAWLRHCYGKNVFWTNRSFVCKCKAKKNGVMSVFKNPKSFFFKKVYLRWYRVCRRVSQIEQEDWFLVTFEANVIF